MGKRATRILSWNLRSHNQRQTTVDRLLQGNDIVMVQETKLKKKPDYDEEAFHVFFTPSEEGGKAKRGLLTVAQKEVDCCEIPTPTNAVKAETLAISIQIEGRAYIAVNIYVPCDSVTTAEVWKLLINPLLMLGPRVIISGDLNARSPMWGDTAHNKNGKALEEALPGIHGVIINNDGPTRIAERAGDSDSCIDLTLVTPSVLLQVHWKLLPLMGSNHRPAISAVQHPRTSNSRTKRNA